MSQQVKVAFASCFPEAYGPFLARFSEIAPEADLWVVSEFQPPQGRWIRYRIDRSFAGNLAAVQTALADREIVHCALFLQPHSPYTAMKAIPLRIAPLRTLLYQETLDHFTLRPNSWPSLLRYAKWKTREYLHWQTHPGGDLYTFLWRLRRPQEFRRPLAYLAAKRATKAIIAKRAAIVRDVAPRMPTYAGSIGVSVVIPSRNGKDLLESLLPSLTEADEIIVIDNGSDDDTEQFLRSEYPDVRIDVHSAPMSFSRAVNRGISMARFSHVLLLNNDMIPHGSFFEPLKQAFENVPDLFCATAQIFLPEGRRREETGKAVMQSDLRPQEFPLLCAMPLEGEDESYVLYGSGGCSLYDRGKLQALGNFSEIYEPAYVEDLDIGYRAWQRGWPTVFAAAAQVTHQHRATTSRYYTPGDLEYITERNYLRFLASAVADAGIFQRLWRHAIDRLNWKAAVEHHAPSFRALSEAKDMAQFVRPAPGADEQQILALGSGEVAVFPCRASREFAEATVVVASAYMPFPLSHGGAVRMYNLMRRAAPSFAQVLVCYVDELHTPPAELLDICVEIVQVRRVGSHVKPERGRPEVVEEFDTPAFRAALRQTVRKWKPQIAQLEFTQMAVFAPDCAPARTILVEHDVTIDLYQQLLDTKEDWELRRQLERWQTFETEAWRNVNCVVVMSDKDAGTIKRARRVVTLPNGVDIERYQQAFRPPQPGRLLFIGSFAHLPNLLAIDFFLREIWPRVQALAPVLHIIAGANHRFHYQRFKSHVGFDLDAPGLLVEDFVADVRPAYEAAALVIAPLLASAGTNIKIMEAMAMGKAIVSTSAGVNGLDLQPGVDVMVENDPERFAEAIAYLISNPSVCERLENQARATVEERFDWDRIAEAQASMYRDIIRS